jgi:glycosyltransferase involved in cell wall biosynthesis
LAHGLAERGVEVDVVCTPPAPIDRTEVAAAPSQLRLLTVGDHVPPADPSNRLVEYWQYRRWQRRSVKVAEAAVAARHYDLVHHYSWGSLLWGSPLWRCGLPMVFGPVGGGAVASGALRGAMRRRDQVFEAARGLASSSIRLDPLARAVVRRSTVLVNETATGRLVTALGGSVAVTVLQDTIDPRWLRVTPTDRSGRGRSVLWAARFLPRKGPTLAVEVAARLPLDVRLTMVGDGPEMGRCRALAEERGVAERIDFVGRVSHDHLRALMERHAVFLYTSIRDTFGGQVAEAAACGTPLVAIRQHGIADHVPPSCGVLVEPDSVAATVASLAEGVRVLLDDHDRWHGASEAARSFASEFSTDRRVEAMMELYERIVSGAV